MSTIENRKINTLRKRLALCCLIIFFICVWSKTKYDDAQYFQEDNMLLMIELTEKEKEIQNLNEELNKLNKEKNSLKNSKVQKIITREKKEDLKQKTDTLKIEIKTEIKDSL